MKNEKMALDFSGVFGAPEEEPLPPEEEREESSLYRYAPDGNREELPQRGYITSIEEVDLFPELHTPKKKKAGSWEELPPEKTDKDILFIGKPVSSLPQEMIGYTVQLKYKRPANGKIPGAVIYTLERDGETKYIELPFGEEDSPFIIISKRWEQNG